MLRVPILKRYAGHILPRWGPSWWAAPLLALGPVDVFADADLSLSKTSASGGVKPPGNVVYTIVVSNAGPDGNLWLTQQTGNKIGRVTVGGAVTEFTIPTANSQPNDIAQAADANLWFTERNGNKIGRITP